MLSAFMFFFLVLPLSVETHPFPVNNTDPKHYIKIDKNFKSVNITEYLEYFEDHAKRYTIDTISDSSLRWENMRGKSVNLGYTDSVCWLHFVIYNKNKFPSDLVLLASTSTVDLMELYVADETKKFSRLRGGDSIPFRNRDTVNYRSFAYPVTLNPGENSCYFRIESVSTIQFAPVLMTYWDFYDLSSGEMVLLTILLGWMMLMMLYNFIIFITSREKSYLYLVLYTFFWALISICIRGVGAQYLWPGSIWFQSSGLVFAVLLAMVFGALFTLSFIDARKKYPRANMVVVYCVVLPAVIIMILSIVISYGIIIQIALLHSIVFIVCVFSLSVYAVVKKNTSAKYLIIGFAFFFVSIPVEVLLDFGFIPLNLVSQWSFEISIAWLVLFSSLGMADKILVMKKDLLASEEMLQIKNYELGEKNEELMATNEEMEAANEELIQSHKEILESENKFRSIYNGVNDAIFIHEINTGKIIDVNDKMPELFGYTREEALKLSLGDLSQEREPYSVENAISRIRLAAGGVPQLFEWVSRDKTGALFPVEVALRRTSFGKDDVILAVVRNISERKKYEEQLLQAQKMETVGTLAGGLAHDFNNVLSGILGPVSILRNRLKNKMAIDTEELGEYLLMMKEASESASNMVKQLLALSARQDLNLAPVDLNNSIKHVMKICGSTLDKSVELKPEYLDVPVMVNADSTQLEQMLLNLCVNAAHAMTIMRNRDEKWGGTLTVSVNRAGMNGYVPKYHPEAGKVEYWCISVSDTGIGIEEADLNKIYNPFFTKKSKGSGTGLGLAMVYNIVRQHDGFINVHSKRGEGTTFNVYLPFVDADDFSLQEEGSPTIHRGQGTILVVDDEEKILITARDMLRECGYDVILAQSGIRGMELLKENLKEIKGVLLDMSMPQMSGKETFVRMKETDPDVKVILMSGFNQDPRIEEVLRLGVRFFLEKPFTLEKLSEAVFNYLN